MKKYRYTRNYLPMMNYWRLRLNSSLLLWWDSGDRV